MGINGNVSSCTHQHGFPERVSNPQIGFQLHPVKLSPDSKALSGFSFTRPGRPAEWSGME
jgi:hypothetical protein